MMTDKEILAGAPEGDVCVDAGNDYFNEHGVMWAEHCKCFDFHDRPEMPCRSLSDIRSLVEKDERIKELEKECDNLKRPIELGDRVIFTKVNLEAHNLYQQAKILKELAREAYTDTKEGCTYHMLLTQKALELTRQAKQLREGVEPKQPGWLRDNNTHTGEGVE